MIRATMFCGSALVCATSWRVLMRQATLSKFSLVPRGDRESRPNEGIKLFMILLVSSLRLGNSSPFRCGCPLPSSASFNLLVGRISARSIAGLCWGSFCSSSLVSLVSTLLLGFRRVVFLRDHRCDSSPNHEGCWQDQDVSARELEDKESRYNADPCGSKSRQGHVSRAEEFVHEDSDAIGNCLIAMMFQMVIGEKARVGHGIVQDRSASSEKRSR